MRELWSEYNRFYHLLLVEFAALKARHELGEIEEEIPDDLVNTIKIDVEEINRIEREITKHDVVAFLEYVSPQFPEYLKPWLHRGLTSYDVVDTALMLLLRRSLEEILIPDIEQLMEAVKDVAMKHKFTLEMGRTHGQDGEIITYGVKMAVWYDELKRHKARLVNLIEVVSVGKLSGAVGMYVLDPMVEQLVCDELELSPIIATQIICRDIISEYMCVLSIVHAGIKKMADNIAMLAQSAVGEVKESFSDKQFGSSAMPHKQNPIGSENLRGLSTVGYLYVLAAFENQADCWYERSLNNSGSERVIIPDSSTLLDYEIRRLTGIFKGLRVFPDVMLENIQRSKGLIYSQEVTMMLVERSDMPREDAHTIIRDIAIECADKRSEFKEALLENSEIRKYVSVEDIESCFNAENKLRHVNYIFTKVFGEE